MTYAQPTGSPSVKLDRGDGSLGDPPGVISILYGAVRVGIADDWTSARELLRANIAAFRDMHYRTSRSEEFYQAELSRVDQVPVDGILCTSDRHSWADTTRTAIERPQPVGVGPGDLAYVHDYSGGRGWWTVDVKAKLLDVRATDCSVRITGESLQFRRGEVRSLPLSFIRRRES